MYAEAQWNNGLRWNIICDEYVLIGIFIQRLLEFICLTLRSIWVSKKSSTVHGSVQNAT